MKKQIQAACFLMITGLFLASCNSSNTADLQNGIWRASLKTATGVEIPFNFEMADSAGKKHLDIINGKERFRVNEIQTDGDSIIIQMPLFDSEIRVAHRGKTLDGRWIKHLASTDVSMPFKAEQGADWRFFKAKSEAKVDLNGKW